MDTLTDKPSILYVDDSSPNLLMFKESLPDEWQVTVCKDPRIALKQIQTFLPAIVISGYQLTGMNGLDFLKQVRVFRPLAIRIIFSGQFNESIFEDALKSELVYELWRKPEDSSQIQIKIESAFAYYLKNSFRFAANIANLPNQAHNGFAMAPEEIIRLALISLGLTYEWLIATTRIASIGYSMDPIDWWHLCDFLCLDRESILSGYSALEHKASIKARIAQGKFKIPLNETIRSFIAEN